MFRRLPTIVKNKFFLATVLFVVIILFVDNNNMIRTLKTRSSIRDLEHKKEHYLKEIEETKIVWEDLNTNTASFEKFARETYLMKKENEVIIIIEEK